MELKGERLAVNKRENFRWPWPETLPETLLKMARSVADLAYAPYSKFKVGSALLMSDGGVVLGCNVENASYGMTICAERSAVSAMVSTGRLDPVAIAVAGDKPGTPCPPCGACRQVLAEFNPDMLVVLESPNKVIIMSVNELLPLSFSLTERK